MKETKVAYWQKGFAYRRGNHGYLYILTKESREHLWGIKQLSLSGYPRSRDAVDKEKKPKSNKSVTQRKTTRGIDTFPCRRIGDSVVKRDTAQKTLSARLCSVFNLTVLEFTCKPIRESKWENWFLSGCRDKELPEIKHSHQYG